MEVRWIYVTKLKTRLASVCVRCQPSIPGAICTVHSEIISRKATIFTVGTPDVCVSLALKSKFMVVIRS